jgi:hypothetical protein
MNSLSVSVPLRANKIDTQPSSTVGSCESYGARDLHCDESVGWCENERVKWDNRWMWVVLESPDNLHFVPSRDG